MRIISGQYRGFQIHAPKNIPARPTTDRSKESLFNILQNKVEIEGLNVLDLCAGTGNISYEFASRGAEHITAVDLNFHAVRFIKETFKKLQYDKAEVIKADALKFVKQSEERQYDLIFADPPYAWSGYELLMNHILGSELLNPQGWLILEHDRKLNLEHPMHVEVRQYGQSAFSLFQKKA